jgi:hypothetical protein
MAKTLDEHYGYLSDSVKVEQAGREVIHCAGTGVGYGRMIRYTVMFRVP